MAKVSKTILVYITNPKLPKDWNVVQTSWRLRTTNVIDSENIIFNEDSKVNKFARLIDIEVEEGTKIYASAEFLYDNGGYSVESLIKCVDYEEADVIALDTDIPTATLAPTITVAGNLKEYDVDVPLTINVQYNKTVETVEHVLTNYYLEDINGNVIKPKLNATDDEKTSYTFVHDEDFKLEYNKLYRLKVNVMGSNGVVSTTVTKTLLTKLNDQPLPPSPAE